MIRDLDEATLQQAAIDYGLQFRMPSRYSRTNKSIATAGRDWVLQSMHNATFKDEFEYLLPQLRDELGTKARAEFDDAAGKLFTPRSDEVFHKLLADKLAITPDGKRIPGKIGSTVVGTVVIGQRLKMRGSRAFAEPVFADVRVGEDADEVCERELRKHQVAGLPVARMALNTNISAAAAIAGLDAIVDLLDGGSSNGILRGYSGTQPVDPNASITGTLLFTCALSDPAFGAASDDTPHAIAAASAITDDSSADATNTLTHVRGWSSNDGSTPLTAIIDGSAGTATADHIFNTVSIVAGAVISYTSWTITLPQGPSAT